MNLLITGADSRLARAVTAALPADVSARLIDRGFSAPPPAADSREGDLRDPDFVKAALTGVESVLHLAPLSLPLHDEQEALDIATRGTYVLANAAVEAGVRRFVLGSSLALFDRLPAEWAINEYWRPRPEPHPAHLGPWLAELSLRECVRDVPSIAATWLRFGEIVDNEESASLPYDPRWLHLDDAVHGACRALMLDPGHHHGRAGWRVFHICAPNRNARIRLTEACRQMLGYEPTYGFEELAAGAPPAEHKIVTAKEALAPVQPIRSRPIRNVVIFGAGGPVSAALAEDLADSYTLRLTDLHPIDELADAKPQSAGAPLPGRLPEPHEWRVVDVRDPRQVMDACEGMDAIVNLTVLRHQLVEAFQVNTLGAYNIFRAAVAHGIRRVVNTGPGQNLSHSPGGEWWDYDVSPESTPRPGGELYFHTKYLGQEIARTFAEYHGLEAPVLLYCQFTNPEVTASAHPFSISWQDSARALRRALEVRELPTPYEVFNINADLPHGKYPNDKAKRLLDWEPRDNLESLWHRR